MCPPESCAFAPGPKHKIEVRASTGAVQAALSPPHWDSCFHFLLSSQSFQISFSFFHQNLTPISLKKKKIFFFLKKEGTGEELPLTHQHISLQPLPSCAMLSACCNGWKPKRSYPSTQALPPQGYCSSTSLFSLRTSTVSLSTGSFLTAYRSIKKKKKKVLWLHFPL